MSYSATVYKIMIASPGDVTEERQIIREVISDWNIVHSESRQIVLLPVGWETHSYPEMGEHPQTLLNKQILRDCDLLVGVFWTRIGTATANYQSGSVEEIEEHLKANKPALLYFSELVGCISKASYTFVNLSILVHDTTFMHPTLLFYGNLLGYLMNTQININKNFAQ